MTHEIKVSDLRIIIKKLLDSVEADEGNVVRIRHGGYWEIPWDKRYDTSNKIDPNAIGQRDLDKDWELLDPVLKCTSSDTHSLVYLASLLKAIGDPR